MYFLATLMRVYVIVMSYCKTWPEPVLRVVVSVNVINSVGERTPC